MRTFWPALLAGGALVLTACGPGGSPAARRANVRVLECSCAAAWPRLIRMLEAADFRLVAKDDAARIATFMWLGAQLPAVLETMHDRENLAMATDGSAVQSEGIRVQSAVLMLTARRRGCERKSRFPIRGGRGDGAASGRIRRAPVCSKTGFFLRSGRPPTVSARRSEAGGKALRTGTESARTARRPPGVPARTLGALPDEASPESDRTGVFDLGRQ